MQSIYIVLIGVIGIIIAIGVGLELSSGIDDMVMYILFWMLYIITIITFVNILLVGNYYITMKDKTGVPGIQGKQGDSGEKGTAGLCEDNCRDSICENALNDLVITELNKRNNGNIVKFNNI